MAEPKKDGVAVTFAREWTIGNRTYQPEEEATLSSSDADAVLRYGYARPADAAVAQRYGFVDGPTIVKAAKSQGKEGAK